MPSEIENNIHKHIYRNRYFSTLTLRKFSKSQGEQNSTLVKKIEIFISKCVLNDSESIPKKFSRKISQFWVFFILYPKSHVLGHLRIILGRNEKGELQLTFQAFYYGYYKLSTSSLPWTNPFFWIFCWKHVFWRFLGQKFFFKKIFLFHLVVLIITKILSHLTQL